MKKLYFISIILLLSLNSLFSQSKLSGSYNIGSSGGNDYTNLTAALADLELNGVTGPVVFLLTASYNSSTETFPLSINNYSGNSSYNNLTIKPAAEVNASITGSTNSDNYSLIIIYAPNVIIDGSNNNTSSQNLTIWNTYTGLNLVLSCVAQNVLIKNCLIRAQFSINRSSGIVAENSPNIFISNNTFKALTEAMVLSNCNALYVGYNNFGSEISAEYIRGAAITVLNSNGSVIRNNNILNVRNTQFDYAYGIYCRNNTGAFYIINNKINSVVSEVNDKIANGINIHSCQNSLLFIANNSINHVASANGSTIEKAPYGICLNSPLITSGVYIYNNTVNMPHDTEFGLNNNALGAISAALFINSSGIFMKNNIFNNMLGERDGADITSIGLSVFCNITPMPFIQTDYNLFNVQTNCDYQNMAYADAAYINLEQFQLWTGSENNSYFTNPLLTETNYPQNCSKAILNGVYLEAVQTDILGLSRSAEKPTIGAYEFQINQASNVFFATPVKGVGYLTWNNGSGCKYIVFMKEGNVLPESPMPVNGTTYNADSNFGLGDEIGTSGWFCVYKGENEGGTIITGNNDEYTIMVCAYYGEDGNEFYIINTDVDNPTLGFISAITENIHDQVKIYPNPAKERFCINYSDGKIIEKINIRDITGKTVYSQFDINNSSTIVQTDILSGVYFIEVYTKDNVTVKKLIIHSK